jgi:hypothetical protein
LNPLERPACWRRWQASPTVAHHLSLYIDAELVIALIIGAIASTPALPYLVRTLRRKRKTLQLASRRGFDTLNAIAETVALMLVFLASLSWMAAGTYNPFLYFGSKADDLRKYQ